MVVAMAALRALSTAAMLAGYWVVPSVVMTAQNWAGMMAASSAASSVELSALSWVVMMVAYSVVAMDLMSAVCWVASTVAGTAGLRVGVMVATTAVMMVVSLAEKKVEGMAADSVDWMVEH